MGCSGQLHNHSSGFVQVLPELLECFVRGVFHSWKFAELVERIHASPMVWKVVSSSLEDYLRLCVGPNKMYTFWSVRGGTAALLVPVWGEPLCIQIAAICGYVCPDVCPDVCTKLGSPASDRICPM